MRRTTCQLFSIIVFFVLMVCGSNGHVSGAVAQGRTIKLALIGKQRYVSLLQLAGFYGLRVTFSGGDDSRVCKMANWNVTVEFKSNTCFFKFNGIQATLSYPVEFRKGDCFLELSDFLQFLDPLLRPKTIPARDIRTVMIDAGHGGNDHGAEKNGVMEKNINLSVARRLGAMLVKRGYRVIYTRSADVPLTLKQRCEGAKNFNPSLFVSIHCNSASDASVNGIEVFIANPAGKPSFGTGTLGKDCPSTKYNTTNALWAYHTQKALIGATGAIDRGIKRKQYYVVRETPAPALLVEIGFVSNDAERTRITQGAYQDKVAVALCSAIDSMKKTLAVPPKKRGGK